MLLDRYSYTVLLEIGHLLLGIAGVCRSCPVALAIAAEVLHRSGVFTVYDNRNRHMRGVFK